MLKPGNGWSRIVVTLLWGLTAMGAVVAQEGIDVTVDDRSDVEDRADPPVDPLTADIGLDDVVDEKELTHDDIPAYYGLLERARLQSEVELSAEGRKFIAARHKGGEFAKVPAEDFPVFYDMITHPAAYRGAPVYLRGHVIQTITYEAGENPYGIETLYESWLITDDSMNHPTTIVFTEKPDDLPVGEDLVDNVSVAGYFLKTHKYGAADKLTRKAPLILAETVTVGAQPTFGPALPGWVGPAVLGVLAVGFALLLWRMFRQDRRRVASHRDEDETPDFSGLEGTAE